MINKITLNKVILSIGLILSWASTQATTYIFVSHSMPDSALRAYFKEAQNHEAILVMRGLYQDDFMATKAKAEDLKITYQIDPNLFDAYGIKQVPVIIQDNDGMVKKITGHIRLQEALRQFAEDVA